MLELSSEVITMVHCIAFVLVYVVTVAYGLNDGQLTRNNGIAAPQDVSLPVF